MKSAAIKFAMSMLLACVISGHAQTTAINYQGKLTDAGNPATGSYDIQFKLFDTPTVGTGIQQGSTITNPAVAVSAGVFAVTLDFGSPVFNGAARYLEIGVRPAGSPNPHTILAPRQPISSSPYAIQTLNASQLGGLAANRYLATDINGNVGIGTSSPSSKLDVRGNLTLDPGTSPALFTAASGGEQNRYLSLVNSPALQTASGLKAGGVLVSDNFFFANPSKNDLIVKGRVGIGTATPQSTLAVQAAGHGITHTDGSVTVGSFVGSDAGWLGTRSNHPLHFFTNDSSPRMTLDTFGNVGIGTTTPASKLTVRAGSSPLMIETSSPNGFAEIEFGNDTGLWATGVGGSLTGLPGKYYFDAGVPVGVVMVINPNGDVGIGTLNPQQRLHVNGRARVASIPLEAWNAHVCFNAVGDLLNCNFSSLHAKTNVRSFRSGLDVVRRLRPISFDWKENGQPGVGLGAEDVAKVEPSLVERNSEGEVSGVKYDRLNLLLINAIREQQQQIERLQAVNANQNERLREIEKRARKRTGQSRRSR